MRWSRRVWASLLLMGMVAIGVYWQNSLAVQANDSFAHTEQEAIAQVVLKQAAQEYCDAEIVQHWVNKSPDGILALPQHAKPTYLVWWFSNASWVILDDENGQTEKICSGGSGTSQFHLAKVVRDKHLWKIVDMDVLPKLNAALPADANLNDYPKAINPRFIQQIKVMDKHRVLIISNKHGDELESNNFPSQRWQYRVDVTKMKVLDAQFIGTENYD